MTDAQPPSAEVCFVAMPYAGLHTPSLALGLLKAILGEAGISATVAPANLWFAETVGLEHYEQCATNLPIVYLAGEWTFAEAAFGDDPRRTTKDAEYLRQLTAALGNRSVQNPRQPAAEVLARVRHLRRAARAFVDETARRVLATGARIVGCTSTFEQHVASLALLRRVRELDPDVVTMIGGANCETDMGEATHRCFEWVDFVVSGEADGFIAPLCRQVLDHGRAVPKEQLPPGVLGPAHREARDARPRPTGRGVFSDLDSLPPPDYRDYFAALDGSTLRDRVRPGLPMETSRGCWWGAVHQCTFCGLNGNGLAFRSKSPQRVLDEMSALQDRHGIGDFEMVDNILDTAYFGSVLPALSEDVSGRRIFYEVKANLGRHQVAALRRAGVTWVQPGIESLHTELLGLMDKGVKGWQNIQLLKWSREYGLRLSWSLLWGFPGEKDEWYEEMAGWMPFLHHLPPPSGVPKMRYDRYSVYHQQARQRRLLLFPIGTLSYVYPVWPADLERLTYFFDAEPGIGPQRHVENTAAALARSPGVTAVLNAARSWRDEYHARRPVLWFVDTGTELVITDTRAGADSRRTVLRGLEREVCLACERAPRPGRLPQLVRDEFGRIASEDDIAAVVDRLVSARLVLPVDGRLLGVALSAPPPPLPDASDFPGGTLLAAPRVPAETRD